MKHTITYLTSILFACAASAQTVALWQSTALESGGLDQPMSATQIADGVDSEETFLVLDEGSVTAGIYGPTNLINYQPMNDLELNPERFLRVSVSPKDGFAINYGDMIMNVWTTVAGATNVAVKTDIDDFETVIFEGELLSGAHTTLMVDLDELGLKNQTEPIEFRIYFWGAQGKQSSYLADRGNVAALEFTGRVRKE